MINRIYAYMIRHNMVEPGSRILAAVSGGADSMCLLETLRILRPRAGFELRVMHVHHGLRENAENDLDCVSKYCESAGIPFQAVRVDARSHARKEKMSVEEAARSLRYEALEQAAREWDQEEQATRVRGEEEQAAREWDKEQKLVRHEEQTDEQAAQLGELSPCRIAVAHHIEDQAETVLFNLIRGSRLTGLRGMLPVSGRIVRPLLEVSRPEIEAFLRQHGITWCEDETNEDLRYSRNLIRKEVMPLLTKINAGAGEHIARAAEEAAEAEEYLDNETRRALLSCYRKIPAQGQTSSQTDIPAQGQTASQTDVPKQGQPASQIDIPALNKEPPLIRRRVVYAVIADAAGGRKDLQDVHVQAVLRLIKKQGNGELDLVGGVHVKRSYDVLYVYGKPGLESVGEKNDGEKSAAEKSICEKSADEKSTGEKCSSAPNGASFTTRVFPFDGDMAAVPRNQYTKWFDYDKIGTFPEFRCRREGDRITLDEGGRSKTIARYMIDEKIPEELRGRIIMPVVGSEILWVPPLAAHPGRISAAYKVSTATRRILEIHWQPDTGISCGQTLIATTE